MSPSLFPASCAGRCGQSPLPGAPCQCHAWCRGAASCCPDYEATCTTLTFPTSSVRPVLDPLLGPSSSSGEVTGAELGSLFSQLLARDPHNARHLVTLEPGCRHEAGHNLTLAAIAPLVRTQRPGQDCSPGPLLRVEDGVWDIATFSKLRLLYDNYEEDVAVREDRSRAERREEDSFLDEVMRTETMKTTLTFLRRRNLFVKSDADFKKLLKELWFENYSRKNRVLASSGFEHVFLGEKKDGKVQGFHNWAFFHDMEKRKKVYLNITLIDLYLRHLCHR